jgi:molybdopterin converting factor small subunit
MVAMQVLVQFRGPLNNHLGTDTFQIDVPSGSTLEYALSVLLEKEPVVGEVWGSPAEMERDAFMMCNGVDVGLLEGIKTVMNDGDSVQVLPLVHGG